MINYFEVLKLDTDSNVKCSTEKDLENLKKQSPTEFKEFTDEVQRKHLSEYNRVQAMINIPGISHQDITDRRDLVIEAKNILSDRNTRDQHITELLAPQPIPKPPDPVDPSEDHRQSTRTIIKFRNGDEATSIPQLATLMEKNDSDAADILYRGRLEQGLAGVGEAPLADAAEEIVKQFSNDNQTGLMAMVSVLRGKIKFQRGGEASTPEQLARLIDQNWEQAKTMLYNGFITLWLKHTNQGTIVNTVQRVVNTYPNEQDVGLEELVQRLDPQIGKPEPEVSQSEIDFGNMSSESQKTIKFSVKNAGRGFLHGAVQLESNMPGLQISNTEINGKGVVTVKLDASALTAKQKHQASLVVDTNGGTVKVPVSCYITYPIQNSIQRLAVSGFSMAAIAFVTRLIIQQFGASGWLATRLTGAGFTEWEQHWQWVVWFEWPGFDWEVKTLDALGSGVEFIIGFVVLGVGAFAYWHFFFRKKSTH